MNTKTEHTQTAAQSQNVRARINTSDHRSHREKRATDKTAHTPKCGILPRCDHTNAESTESSNPTAIGESSEVADKKVCVTSEELANSVDQKASSELGKISNQKSSRPTVENANAAENQSQSSSQSTIETATERSTENKGLAAGGFISGSKNKDTRKARTDYSASTVIAREGNSENARTRSTPGPWRLTDAIAPDGVGQCYEIEVDNLTIALVYPADELESNARLIAAAPRMLKALERASIYLSESGDFEDLAVKQIIDSVITEATQ